MDRHACSSTTVAPDTELEASGCPGDLVVCDLPTRLPVTKDEVDAVLFHARDLIEALKDIGFSKGH